MLKRHLFILGGHFAETLIHTPNSLCFIEVEQVLDSAPDKNHWQLTNLIDLTLHHLMNPLACLCDLLSNTILMEVKPI